MADFSIQSTQINPVANAVTPQAGVVDQSGEILGKAIAGAIGPAAELYGTVKEQDFKKEAEQEFRMNLGYTVDPLGNQYPPKTAGEKELDQLVDRASQMGVMGSGNNAALILAARAREKIAKEPWFAERYKRAAGQINEEYAQTIQLLSAAAEKAAANQSAEEKALEAKRKEVYDNAAGSGISFTDAKGQAVPIDLMDRNELILANQLALEQKSERMAYDLYLKKQGEERAVAGEERAKAKEGRAVASSDTTRSKEAFAQFSNNVLGKRETAGSERITNRFYSFVDSGLIATNPAEAQKQFNAAATEELVRLRTELNRPVIGDDGKPIFLDKASAQAAYERLDAQINSYREFIFGEKSNAAVVAANAKYLKDSYDLDILKDPLLGKVLSLPINIQQNVWAKLNLDPNIEAGLQTSARNLFTAQDKAQAISNMADGKPVDPAMNGIATAAAIAGIDPAVATQQPQMFNNFLSQVAGQIPSISPNERPQAYVKVLRTEVADIVGNLPDPSGATENIRKIAAQMIYDLQTGLGPAISTVQYSGGQGGQFISTNPATKQTVDSLNTAMKILETVDKHGPIQFGSRDALAVKFFGVNMGTPAIQVQATPEQPAQEQPQGSGGNTNLGGSAGKDTLESNYGARPDGTPKYTGFLGELKLPGGGVATEYSMQSNAVKDSSGKRIDFPTLVPTLTKEEIDLMVNDIIPNEKDPPEAIIQKAIAHAKKRMAEGKSPFLNAGEK